MQRIKALTETLAERLLRLRLVRCLTRRLWRLWTRLPFLHRLWTRWHSTVLPTAQAAIIGTLTWLNYMLSPGMVIRLIKRNLQAFVACFLLFLIHQAAYKTVKKSMQTIREYISLAAGSGRYRKIRILTSRMKQAVTYDEWKAYADEIDILNGKMAWKDDSESALYDWKRIQALTQDIRRLRESKNIPEIMRYMRSRLLRNIAGSGHRRLFSHLRAGTKRLIEEFQEEVVRALHLVALEHTSNVSIRQKLAFFNETRHSLGRTALMLSGGAAFGCYHIGVVKALHESHMLPKIISGASAGSIIAAWVGCMTDDDLDHMTESGKVNLDLFPPMSGAFFRKIYRLLNTGVLFDIQTLARCLRANVGDTTFAEAYARSGRIINIIVAPANNSMEVPRLLNYLTTPDVVIWSAAAASSAIPYFYQPVELLMKNKDGKIVPYYTKGVRWSDGSFHADLPMQRLAELFNVNYYLVSQVNPHVIPFAIHKEFRLRSVSGILVNMIIYCADQLRHNIMVMWKNAKLVIPAMQYLSVIPTLFNQDYFGDITVVPRFRLQDYYMMLSNPSPELLAQTTRITELLTWRKMAEIKNSCDIEVALDSCVRIMRATLMMSNEINVEQGTSLLSNRLASWAPEQFEMLQKIMDDNNATRLPLVPQRSSSVDTVLPPFGVRHGGPQPERYPESEKILRPMKRAVSIVNLADTILQANGVAPSQMNLPSSHDQSEDIFDHYIP